MLPTCIKFFSVFFVRACCDFDTEHPAPPAGTTQPKVHPIQPTFRLDAGPTMLSLDGDVPDSKSLKSGNSSSRNNSLTFGSSTNTEDLEVPMNSEDLNHMLENTTDKLELTQILLRLQSSCRSAAINLVHVQQSLKESVQATTSTTKESLEYHTSNLASYSAIVSAAVNASTTLTTHHETVKRKLHELEHLSTKIQRLKIIATNIEKHILEADADL